MGSSMKILTILGTRPEIIRLSRVIPLLDEVCAHTLVNTGQNYDPNLSANFFDELGVRKPDYQLEVQGSFGIQMAMLIPGIEKIVSYEKPDRVLILGDTNSSLAAIVAARSGVPVYHMEAGNRSFSPTSPEEVNRRLVDHCSTVHLPYTERSRANLLAEGIESRKIFVTGNPIGEVLDHYEDKIDQSDVLARLGLEAKKYFLVTLHRAENVDDFGMLGNFQRAFDGIQREYQMPVIVSTHPRLRLRMGVLNRTSPPKFVANKQVRFLDPFGFFDFIQLQKNAFCTLSDSGTVQEESAILNVPSVTLRDYTERPECVECGASILSGSDPQRILDSVKLATRGNHEWEVPAEYLRPNVAETVVKILLGHLEAR